MSHLDVSPCGRGAALVVVVVVVMVVSGARAGGADDTHQVHNLLLYPHRHSWCEARHVQQIVQHQHCTSQVIDNRICVGQCFSYTVPRTIPEEPGDDGLHYCDTCRPSNYTWIKVVLECDPPAAAASESSDRMEFLVEIISACSCALCTNAPSQPDTPDVIETTSTGHTRTTITPPPVSHRKHHTYTTTNTPGDAGLQEKKLEQQADVSVKTGKHHHHRHHRHHHGYPHPDTYLYDDDSDNSEE